MSGPLPLRALPLPMSLNTHSGPAGVCTFSFSADRDTRTNLTGKVQREQCIFAVKSTQQLLRVSDVTRKQGCGLWIYAQHRSGGPKTHAKEQQQALFTSSSASYVGDLTLFCTGDGSEDSFSVHLPVHATSS